jgi:hypothetical protein
MVDGPMFPMDNTIIFMGKHIIGIYIAHSKSLVSFWTNRETKNLNEKKK